jgi:hypothetical protein
MILENVQEKLTLSVAYSYKQYCSAVLARRVADKRRESPAPRLNALHGGCEFPALNGNEPFEVTHTTELSDAWAKPGCAGWVPDYASQ